MITARDILGKSEVIYNNEPNSGIDTETTIVQKSQVNI